MLTGHTVSVKSNTTRPIAQAKNSVTFWETKEKTEKSSSKRHAISRSCSRASTDQFYTDDIFGSLSGKAFDGILKQGFTWVSRKNYFNKQCQKWWTDPGTVKYQSSTEEKTRLSTKFQHFLLFFYLFHELFKRLHILFSVMFVFFDKLWTHFLSMERVCLFNIL